MLSTWATEKPSTPCVEELIFIKPRGDMYAETRCIVWWHPAQLIPDDDLQELAYPCNGSCIWIDLNNLPQQPIQSITGMRSNLATHSQSGGKGSEDLRDTPAFRANLTRRLFWNRHHEQPQLGSRCFMDTFFATGYEVTVEVPYYGVVKSVEFDDNGLIRHPTCGVRGAGERAFNQSATRERTKSSNTRLYHDRIAIALEGRTQRLAASQITELNRTRLRGLLESTTERANHVQRLLARHWTTLLDTPPLAPNLRVPAVRGPEFEAENLRANRRMALSDCVAWADKMQCFTRAAMQWAAAHDLDSGPRCVDFYPVWTAARLVREQANFLHDALSLAFVFSPTGGDVPIPTLQQLPRPVKGVIGAGGIADQLLTPIDVFISSLEHITRR